ncbi:MAG TPA: phenylalanine--tRNA ligase subunit alpha [Gemmatimonadaceae bacterium]|nr:phenylalanine--tRNA ligase subunit alpha [Gemmatimonadaceae bacterium]
MTLDELIERIADVESKAAALIASAESASALETARTSLVGRKSGELTALIKELPNLPPEERRDAGAAVNRAKTSIEAALDTRAAQLSSTEAPHSTGDLTMPARRMWKGGKHPVTVVIEEIEDIFRELGFTIALGPEAETEWHNFRALNFPPDHPAMDMHDTLYLEDNVLLRTHTSPVQIRTLQNYKPPIRILAPGNAYRRDFFDASHAPVFAQIEGLSVDDGVSFVDLKATLTRFANRFFGKTTTRFRPSFFPFTEPSAEMDVECQLCKGAGCAACKGSGWTEILGSGMVHPSVLDASGVDSERYTGWAFGMGPARIAMQRYGIPDIRLLYDSDMRFLEQLSG